MLNRCRQIVFNPLSWIHPGRLTLPENFRSPRCQSLLNDFLLRQYQLPTEAINLNNAQEKFLVENWAVLARAAFMVACQRQRLRLARTGLFARLDRATRQFALAELTPAHDDSVQLDFAELWHNACGELNVFAAGCSETIKKRVVLLCPEAATGALMPELADNEFLLRMAVQNARRAA
ncbi:hypothetical protein [Kalamiella sp. sgz302252]|uniref:hypothetical protein n=1 Tax=Pantoea sp. sgz302252 TaxID=3341827 RepID=UPI0036D2B7EF